MVNLQNFYKKATEIEGELADVRTQTREIWEKESGDTTTE